MFKAPRRAADNDAPGLEANRLRRATGSHDPYSKMRSESESTPSMAPHKPMEGIDV
jgi:hypothetical protein